MTVEKNWQEILTPDEYAVLREGGTETPWTGELIEEKRQGKYRCRACDAVLFASDTKFDSHCGWPSFYAPLAKDTVKYLEDNSLGERPRVEVRCANCDSHLGHVFHGEGYETPTDDRFCINSICMTFDEE
ncbi:peptide-methionine (R)-S-oxide reductase MsrB [Salininema proteolyticum]|uniref:peptide-methionine (R)-S-oxide reductase n=1 Tax=Salininema proteolyticum TaxID=1607685 RepID=A0ABV8U2F6_9ACTN